MNIELKSTGFLIDEYLTAGLKFKYIGGEEISNRLGILHNVIKNRLVGKNSVELNNLISKLHKVLSECWDAQENVMSYRNKLDMSDGGEDDNPNWFRACAMSAITAQELNVQRNRLIREIDELLGESEFTQLEKSYA